MRDRSRKYRMGKLEMEGEKGREGWWDSSGREENQGDRMEGRKDDKRELGSESERWREGGREKEDVGM